MARKKKQDNFIKASENKERYLDRNFSDSMKNYYIDYAMSVIVDRAVPDIRDGLKPVQRRILYDMDILNIRSDKETKKSARVVGDTMGKFHPHGDTAIYDAMVALSQDYRKPLPLVYGHGNFGSIEGDNAAAMRYTETKLEKYSEDILLSDLKNNTVDFVYNYDQTEYEPVVLPAKLPNLLINGSTGIAVGMVTNIPPHNLSEVVDASIYLLDNPNARLSTIMKHIKGPDFPTGGYIVNKEDIKDIYEKGSGKLNLAAKMDEIKSGTNVELVISEIPYTIVGGVGDLIDKIINLSETKVLPEVTNVRNETSKEGVKIVLELKKNADIELVKSILFSKTKLSDTYSVNFLAIHENKPFSFTIIDYLNIFNNYQIEIYTKKFNKLLSDELQKKEINEGLIRAVDIIDLIIEIIRGSKKIEDAKKCLTKGIVDKIKFKTKKSENLAKKLDFTELQATSILSLRLSRLVGLEIDILKKEYEENLKNIGNFEKLLNDKNELKKEIKKNLRDYKKEYGKERKTKIINHDLKKIEREIEIEDVVVLIDKLGYILNVPKTYYDKNKESIINEYTNIIETKSNKRIVIFTSAGKAHILKVEEVPYYKTKSKGVMLDTISNYDASNEKMLNAFVLDLGDDIELTFALSNGLVKYTLLNEFDLSRKTVDALRLPKNTTLVNVLEKIENNYIVIGSTNGYYTRIKQEEIPIQKRNSSGVKAINLKDNAELNRIEFVSKTNSTIIIDDKKIPSTEIKLSKRGTKGTLIQYKN